MLEITSINPDVCLYLKSKFKKSMNSFSKWLGAGLGFTLGGPIGAAIGFAIGSFVDGFTLD